MKKPWKDRAVAYINETGRCPGTPSFGMPEDRVTAEEFASSVDAGGTHPYKECHYLDEMLGTAIPDGMQAIETNVPTKITDKDVAKVEAALSDSTGEQTVESLKRDLKVYVDMITLKRPGVLYIPEPLLKVGSYVKKFFDVG